MYVGLIERKGIEKGLAQGLEQGILLGKTETIREMLLSGESEEKIISFAKIAKRSLPRSRSNSSVKSIGICRPERAREGGQRHAAQALRAKSIAYPEGHLRPFVNSVRRGCATPPPRGGPGNLR